MAAPNYSSRPVLAPGLIWCKDTEADSTLIQIKKNEKRSEVLAPTSLEERPSAGQRGDSGRAHLAGRAGLPSVPATVAATVAHEGRVAAEQDVEDDAQAPQVTALVVDAGLLTEGLHHLWGHVLG